MINLKHTVIFSHSHLEALEENHGFSLLNLQVCNSIHRPLANVVLWDGFGLDRSILNQTSDSYFLLPKNSFYSNRT